ncbi:MAG TPA: hypothetical protein P5136_00475 [Methanofastidiosum sp.]|nr:hypothetical protein [Methanofastidiosum sp.]
MEEYLVVQEIRNWIKETPTIVPIPNSSVEKAKEFAEHASQLKMTEENHLYDNINEDGRSFIGKLGEIAIEILFGRPIIDWNIGHSNDFNKPDLYVAGVGLGIKSVLERHLCPLVSKRDPKMPEIITVVHEIPILKASGTTQIIDHYDYSVYICGLATIDVLKNCRGDMFVKNKNKRNGPLKRKTAFWGFKYLKRFKNEDELGRMLK